MDDERIIKCPKCRKTVRVEIEDVMDISVLTFARAAS